MWWEGRCIGCGSCQSICAREAISFSNGSLILDQSKCDLCEACVDACKEDAITLDQDKEIPIIDYSRCLRCRHCINECPTGTIAVGKTGYRVLLGGKLGRHPRLAEELPGIYSEDEVVAILEQCVAFYKQKSKRGERFAAIFWEARDKKEIPVPSLRRDGDSQGRRLLLGF